MKKTHWLFAAGAALVLTAAVQAQRFGESVQVTIVEVPVTVADRSGTAVPNLTREDFEVFDDGKRVPIEYFEAVDLAAVRMAPRPGEPPPPSVATRHFLLLFDLANSEPGTIERAGEAARRFIDKEIGERDLAAVAVFTAESGMKMLTSFTTNRTLLEDAVTTLGNPSYFKLADPLMISAVVTPAPGSGPAESGVGTRAIGAIDAAVQEKARELDRMTRTTRDSEMRNRLRIQLDNFGAVARTLDRLKGQKQVILLSEGFDARLIQGRENLGFESTRSESDAVMSGEVWNVDTEQRFGNTSSGRDLNDMVELFRRSDVVLHAIDIKGLRSGVDASEGATRSSNESLFLLTKPTGGTVFKNANNLTEDFERMMEQQKIVYLIGFTARGTGKPGKFHDLKVKTRAGRVSHRTGYYEAGARLTDLERTLSLAEIMITDAPIEDVEVRLTPATLPGPGGKSRVPVVVDIPGKRMLEEVEGNAATANLYLYAFDQKSEVVDFLQQRISLDLTKAGDAVRGSGIRYFGTLRLPPGDFAIKAVVRVEESGRIGFARHDVSVPAFDSAFVSAPLLFAEPGDWITLAGPARGDQYAYPFAAGETTYVPRTSAELRADSEYKLALFLYRVPLENLEVQPAVLTAGVSQPATVKLLGRTPADERGGIKLLFSFDPTGIAAGDHELQFDVKTKDGMQKIVSMPFVVR